MISGNSVRLMMLLTMIMMMMASRVALPPRYTFTKWCISYHRWNASTHEHHVANISSLYIFVCLSLSLLHASSFRFFSSCSFSSQSCFFFFLFDSFSSPLLVTLNFICPVHVAALRRKSQRRMCIRTVFSRIADSLRRRRCWWWWLLLLLFLFYTLHYQWLYSFILFFHCSLSLLFAGARI